MWLALNPYEMGGHRKPAPVIIDEEVNHAVGPVPGTVADNDLVELPAAEMLPDVLLYFTEQCRIFSHVLSIDVVAQYTAKPLRTPS